jgi:hypothetical protein
VRQGAYLFIKEHAADTSKADFTSKTLTAARSLTILINQQLVSQDSKEGPLDYDKYATGLSEATRGLHLLQKIDQHAMRLQ